jgi:ComF family protein
MLQRIASLAASSLRYSADLILPPLCIACGTLITHHNLLCPACWTSLYLITPPLCNRLGIPLPGYEGEGPHVSVQAIANPPVFSRARAAAHYSGIMRRLIVHFKFEDKHEPLPLFVRLMREAGRELLNEADLLVPAPLHRLRLLQRRFNQSALLAQGIGRAAGVAVSTMALRRMRRTEAQVGLGQEARLENVAKAFGVHPRYRAQIEGKAVVLIDDVITTGSTAGACATALLAAGAARVDVLAIALVAHGLAEPDDQDYLGEWLEVRE